MVMPEGYKSNSGKNRQYVVPTAKWHIKIPYQPMIKASMPHPPEALKPIIIKDTSTHIINSTNTIKLGPYFSRLPNDQKLVPNENQAHQGKQLHLDEGHLFGWLDDGVDVLVQFE
jgi:hypothetical protein